MITIRNATRHDLPAIVALLADDPLGRHREDGESNPAYVAAFEAIDADPNHELLVAEDGDRIVGTVQISYSPGLSRKGAWRATLEGVRVASALRGHGIGKVMIEGAIDRARARHCRIVQLTSDLSRSDAIRFYESLGFSHTHAGMKLTIAVTT